MPAQRTAKANFQKDFRESDRVSRWDVVCTRLARMKGLILIYIITAIAAFGGLRFPLLAFYVYVGLAVLRPQAIFGWAGDLSNLSLIVGTSMLIGWVVNGFGSWRFGRGRAVLLLLLGFVSWFTLSGFLGIHVERSMDSLVGLSKVVLPVLVGATMIREAKHWRWLLWTIVLCQGYVGFEMNLDYLVKNYNTASTGYGGMDNNFFALALVTVLGPAVALTIASRTWLERGLAALSAALILHTTLLTFSRGGMVGLLAMAATAFVMVPKKPKHMAVVLLTMLLAVQLTGPELMERYMTTFAPVEERDGSAQGRVELWRDCLIVIGRYPVFGVGPANWVTIAAQYGWPVGKSAHSVWMETAAENGIPGALLLLSFFGLAAWRLWPIARGRAPGTDPYEQALAAGGVLAIVGFAVTGQFVSAPSLEVPYYVVTACIGMLKLRTVRLATAASVAVDRPVAATAPAHVPAMSTLIRPASMRPPVATRPSAVRTAGAPAITLVRRNAQGAAPAPKAGSSNLG